MYGGPTNLPSHFLCKVSFTLGGSPAAAKETLVESEAMLSSH